MPVPPVRAGEVLACALFLSIAGTADAQKSKASDPAPALDPYTGGAPERFELLGYRSFGPFLFGSTSNEVVQSHLGGVPMLWVETPHFRLGSSLAEYRLENLREIEDLRRELERLRQRLATVPAKPRKLDPWLRLHLYARRLEDLYEDVCARLGVSAPEAAGAQASEAPGAVMSMREKFCVLLTQKESTLARFTGEYCDSELGDAAFHHFLESGSLFFGRSDESMRLTDSDLHYALVYGVTQLLLMGINGYPHTLPAWWQIGAALWFARDREPRILLFTRPGGEALPGEELEDWEALVRGRVQTGACLEWREMLARPSWRDQPFGDNIVLWSRIDFLLRREGTAAALVNVLHGRDALPPSDLALQAATGVHLRALDAEWQAWVKETYRKQRR